MHPFGRMPGTSSGRQPVHHDCGRGPNRALALESTAEEKEVRDSFEIPWTKWQQVHERDDPCTKLLFKNVEKMSYNGVCIP